MAEEAGEQVFEVINAAMANRSERRCAVGDKRYIIMELSDAKALALNASAGFDEQVARVIARIESEEGADIEDIVAQLKGIHACPACVIEGQERSCCAWHANKLGRRLRRLVDRANAGSVGDDAQPESAG